MLHSEFACSDPVQSFPTGLVESLERCWLKHPACKVEKGLQTRGRQGRHHPPDYIIRDVEELGRNPI